MTATTSPERERTGAAIGIQMTAQAGAGLPGASTVVAGFLSAVTVGVGLIRSGMPG